MVRAVYGGGASGASLNVPARAGGGNNPISQLAESVICEIDQLASSCRSTINGDGTLVGYVKNVILDIKTRRGGGNIKVSVGDVILAITESILNINNQYIDVQRLLVDLEGIGIEQILERRLAMKLENLMEVCSNICVKGRTAQERLVIMNQGDIVTGDLLHGLG